MFPYSDLTYALASLYFSSVILPALHHTVPYCENQIAVLSSHIGCSLLPVHSSTHSCKTKIIDAE